MQIKEAIANSGNTPNLDPPTQRAIDREDIWSHARQLHPGAE
jgi:hypothetical protein